MKNDLSAANEGFMGKAINTAIRIAMIGLMAAWCFAIVRPFITLIFWSIIIAVAVYPGFQRLAVISGGRYGFTAILVTGTLLLIIAGPTVMLADVVVDNAQVLATQLKSGSLSIPLPPSNVRSWPLVGAPLADFWTLASGNLEKALAMFAPQLKLFGRWLLTSVTTTGLEILKFILAIVIAGILLANSAPGSRVAHDIAGLLVGARGGEYILLIVATIRGVAKGVLGVALIQSILAGTGFMVADVPGAGLLALLCFFLAVIQLGPVLVIIPVVIYVFSIHDYYFALPFLIWNIFVALIDNILKPLLMGRGAEIPMMVIFLGAIGGLLLSGVIGLFVGAVVLALGYKLLQVWLGTSRETA